MFKHIRSKFAKKASRDAPSGPIEFLIVGLGNPGREYEGTRHNTGFAALDALAGSMGVSLQKLKFQSQIGQGMLQGHRVLLMKPSTFMNRSGIAVRDAADFYKLPPERILVIYDDVALPVGRMRIRPSGSDGGQKGMQNILYLNGEDTLPRIRIGIGAKPHPDYDLADWVLSRFSADERALMEDAYKKAAEAAALIVDGQITEAMARYNGK